MNALPSDNCLIIFNELPAISSRMSYRLYNHIWVVFEISGSHSVVVFMLLLMALAR